MKKVIKKEVPLATRNSQKKDTSVNQGTTKKRGQKSQKPQPLGAGVNESKAKPMKVQETIGGRNQALKRKKGRPPKTNTPQFMKRDIQKEG